MNNTDMDNISSDLKDLISKMICYDHDRINAE